MFESFPSQVTPIKVIQIPVATAIVGSEIIEITVSAATPILQAVVGIEIVEVAIACIGATIFASSEVFVGKFVAYP
jgi:hypothetical protein